MAEGEKKKGKAKQNSKSSVSCESCEFYDYDDEYEQYYCTQKLDEDEMIRFLNRDTFTCPYYRYYDEYKVVRKQN